MVKKNSKKIINNDDFPPLPVSPTRTKNPTSTGTGQQQDSAWIKVGSKQSKSVSPTAEKFQLPNLHSTKLLSKLRR